MNKTTVVIGLVVVLVGSGLWVGYSKGQLQTPWGGNASTATLEGTVTTSPTCPVERTPPDPACAPRPYSTLVSVTGGQGTHTAHTDEKGFYSIKVAPGSYEISASGGSPIPSCKPEAVTVVANQTITLNLSCDSGIR